MTRSFEVEALGPDVSETRKSEIAEQMCAVSCEGFGAVAHQLGVNQDVIDDRFADRGGLGRPDAWSDLREQLDGTVKNGVMGQERQAKTYAAFSRSNRDELLGWVTTAADYTDGSVILNPHIPVLNKGFRIDTRVPKRLLRSFLWFVNGAVVPNDENMCTSLFYEGLSDLGRPSIKSLRTRVAAYPIIHSPEEQANGTLTPAQKLLLKAGLAIKDGDEPIKDAYFLGAPTWLQRMEGPSPEQCAENLVRYMEMR